MFWPCGVTPRRRWRTPSPPIVITHAPGHMFITDILNTELNDYLEASGTGPGAGVRPSLFEKKGGKNFVRSSLPLRFKGQVPDLPSFYM